MSKNQIFIHFLSNIQMPPLTIMSDLLKSTVFSYLKTQKLQEESSSSYCSGQNFSQLLTFYFNYLGLAPLSSVTTLHRAEILCASASLSVGNTLFAEQKTLIVNKQEGVDSCRSMQALVSLQPCATPCEQEPESLLSFSSLPVVGRCHDSSAFNSKTFPFVLHDSPSALKLCRACCDQSLLLLQMCFFF